MPPSTEAPLGLMLVSPALSKDVEECLRSIGFSPVSANSSREALYTLAALNCSFIVVELERDTAEAIQKIKAVDINIPTLVLADENSTEHFLDLLKYPRMLAVFKPFNPEIFKKAVERVRALPPANDASRRNSLRVAVSLPADLGGLGNGTITSLSLGGVFIETPRTVTLDSRIFIQFSTSESRTLIAEARIVRVEENGFGAAFMAITQKDWRALRSYLILKLEQSQSRWAELSEDPRP